MFILDVVLKQHVNKQAALEQHSLNALLNALLKDVATHKPCSFLCIGMFLFT